MVGRRGACGIPMILPKVHDTFVVTYLGRLGLAADLALLAKL